MTTEQTTSETNGNGEKKTKGPTLLQTLHQEWLAAGGKMPSKNEGNKLIQALEAAKDKLQAAEENVERAKAKVSEASLACVKAFGTGMNLPIHGIPHAPMSRQDQVYYRNLGSSQTWEG